jgi:sec-independent protein translocase protein TatB
VFGIGPLELGVLALLAFLMFGERLPEMARDAARLVHRLRTMADGATKGLRDELGPEFADLDVRDLHPRTLIQKHVMDAVMNEGDSPMQTPVARSSTPTVPTTPAGPKSSGATSYDTDAT